MSIPKQAKRLEKAIWEIPPDFKKGMRVPARIHATPQIIAKMEDGVFEQITNVATLPGVVKHVCCMPDGHWGYGFPIGGVAAMDLDEGVISPGGIGFDINCGMRLVRTSLTLEEVKPKIKNLIDCLFNRIPSGVGGESRRSLSHKEMEKVLTQGAGWAVKNGYGWDDDLEFTEDNGCRPGANPDNISPRAMERGRAQVGTLGSGNHYLEIQVIQPGHVLDPENAKVMGVDQPGQIVVMFHCGSRGFGHQVATDYLKVFSRSMMAKHGIEVPDRNLACAPIKSKEGRDYFSAMNCAMNMAFANRQMILHHIRNVFAEVFKKTPEQLGMHQIYDVTHNTAKIEKHRVGDRVKEVLVHRKGATRSFGPGHGELPGQYQRTGQPVILGGSMETGSYLLMGTERSEMAFSSTSHGSGRTMSRAKAKKVFHGRQVQKSMMEKGIYVQTDSFSGLAEEAGGAYKDIDEVVEAVTQAGLSRPVVKFTPMGNVKG